MTATASELKIPSRIRVAQEGDTTVVRLHASALPGKIFCTWIIAILIGLPIGLYLTNEDAAALVDETQMGGAEIAAIIIPAIILVGIVLTLAMRGFNVTTFRMTPTELTRLTVPFGLGKRTIPREEINGVGIRQERPSRIGREDGLHIYPYTIDVIDADKKRHTVKGTVRGRQHSLYIGLMIARTYDLGSADSLEKRFRETQSINPIFRLLVD